MDSGIADNFLDCSRNRKCGISISQLEEPLNITALDGRPLGSGLVHHLMAPIQLTLDEIHHEIIQFHLVDFPEFPLVPDYTWLARHNPSFNWQTGTLEEWGHACHASCLKFLPSQPSASPLSL